MTSDYRPSLTGTSESNQINFNNIMSDSESASTSITQEEGKGSVKSDIHLTPPLLNGKYFRVESISYDGKIKASCTSCTDGKKPLSGAIGSTTNFLNHLKVSLLFAVDSTIVDKIYFYFYCLIILN